MIWLPAAEDLVLLVAKTVTSFTLSSSPTFRIIAKLYTTSVMVSMKKSRNT